MDWKEMHIGIDLGLQELNSAQSGKLQPQAKDYYLNRVTMDLILGEGKDSIGKDNIPILTTDELRNKYVYLEPYLRAIKLDLVRGSKFDYGIIPKGFTDDISSGFLYDGIEYKVVDPGTGFSLTSFGASTPLVKNSKFVANIIEIPGTFEDTNWRLVFQVGGKYRIVNPGTYDFTQVGAENSMIGTEFISTSGLVVNAGLENAIVKPLRHAPAWGSTGAVLRSLSPFDLLMFYSSHSNVDVGYSFSDGKLIQGTTYRVVNGGTISGLTGFGSISNTVGNNYMFTSIKTGVPVWAQSGVVLTETREFPNKLVDFKELETALDYGFGASIDSPICCLVGGTFRVYHESKFRVNYVNFDYICTPVKIDAIAGINSDLNIGVHGQLVDRVIQRITGHRGQPQYNAVLNENEKLK